MAKVDTLLKLISYQKQRPWASDQEIAAAIGISERHVRRCKKEMNLFKHELSFPTLTRDQIRFVISTLNPREPYQREISQQLQRQLGASYFGRIRLARPNEQLPVGWLDVGEITSIQTGSSNRQNVYNLPLLLTFWLQYLGYEPLMFARQNGEIEARLATECEPVKGFSEWHLRLKKNLRWSDGTRIDIQDIMQAFNVSWLAPIITEMKPDGNTQLCIRLSRDEPLFCFYLRGVLPLPSQLSQVYRIFSGPYCVKRFRRNAVTFRFERNPGYYREQEGNIEWLTLTRFTLLANAVKAVENQKLDLLHVRMLQSLYEFPITVPCQQWPFSGNSYYVLFLNRQRELLSDERNCQLLKEAIDYRAINSSLHMEHFADEEQIRLISPRSLDVRVTSSGEECDYLAHLVGRSVRSSVANPLSIPKADRQNKADAHVVQFFMGPGYNRLSQFFASDGQYNPIGYTNPQVDEMLFELDRTADMAKRQEIAGDVLSFLQEDFAMILLSPCFEYALSPLEIESGDKLMGPVDLMQNMSNVVVERNNGR